MKTVAYLMAAAALVCLSARSFAASVGPSGYANDFATQPPATDWATLSVAGAAGVQYDMDTNVNFTITGTGVTAQTAPGTGTPPAAAGTAIWHSTAFYLQTRPTGNRYTALMAKFVNNSGTNATEIRVGYDFTVVSAGVPEETGRGTRAYYSLTGLADSWVNIGVLNTTESANLVANRSATISVPWPDGGSLYL